MVAISSLVNSMWECEKCHRTFKRINQSHYCSKAPLSVDEYINSYDSRISGQLSELRSLILEIPNIKESIKWSMPIYEYQAQSISFAANKKNISLYVSDEVMIEFQDKLPSYAYKKNAIYFDYDKKLPQDLIREILKNTFKLV